MPGARCTRSLACEIKQSTRASSPRGPPGSPDIPARNGFNGYFVLSPVTGLFCHRHPRKLPFANLTPASGRQDHTTSPSASAPFVKCASASTASRPAFVTIAKRPSEGRDGEYIGLIWVFGKSEYFFKRGWTRGAINCPLICPSGKSTGPSGNRWVERLVRRSSTSE